MKRSIPLGLLRLMLIGNVRGVADDPATVGVVFPTSAFHTRDQSMP